MHLYLDCDTGIDDSIAIAFLLAHPSVHLAGIGTVNGNTSALQAAANTLGLLTLARVSDMSVSVGAGDASDPAVRVHGGNGVGGVDLPIGAAADPRTADTLLIDLARRHSGELHVLATGPCTNLARALHAEPRLPAMVASVTVMGGAVRVAGNITPRAEANIHNDPMAAAEVLAAPWPVTLVPLDVTMHHRWAEPDRQALRAGGSPLLTALAEMLPVYFDFYEPLLGTREIPLHDPLAAGIAVGALEPASAPVLDLAVDLSDGTIREGGSSRVRVVRSLSAPAAPVILRGILDGFGSAT